MHNTEPSVLQPTVNYSHRAKQSGEVFTTIEYRFLIKVTFTLCFLVVEDQYCV